MNTLTERTIDLDFKTRLEGGSRLHLHDKVEVDSLVMTRYMALVVERDLRHIWRADWSTTKSALLTRPGRRVALARRGVGARGGA